MSEQEFVAAYDRYNDKIFRHCYFRLYDREKALDLMQDTFMKTWTYIADGNEIDNIQAFLYKVANNLILDDVRKRKMDSLEEMEEEDGFVPSVSEIENVQNHIDADAILELVHRLHPSYQTVFTMRYVDELSPKEIANLLNESENVVSVRLYRAVQKIRQLLP